MDGISRSRGWDKEILHGVLPMEQLVLSDKWARKSCPFCPCIVADVANVAMLSNRRYVISVMRLQ